MYILIIINIYIIIISYELSDIFKNMGMNLPFDDIKADFSGMCKSIEPVYIDKVIH